MDPGDLSVAPDGFRVEVVDEGDAVVVRLSLVAGDVVVATEAVHSAAADAAGRAEVSRVVPLCEAIASYLSYGGAYIEVAQLAAAFACLGAVAPSPGLVHVVTSVEAKRTHVFARAAEGDYLVVDEGDPPRVTVATASDVFTLCEAWGHADGAADDDDWSFLDDLRRPLVADASEEDDDDDDDEEDDDEEDDDEEDDDDDDDDDD